MNKFILLTSVAAFSLVSGVAGAVTIKNTDKTEATLHVTVDGKQEMVKLKEGESYDSKGKDISYSIAPEKKLMSAKGSESLEIKSGKVEMVKLEPAKDQAAPAAGVIEKAPAKTIDTKTEEKK
jgi:hypothetical protein